MAIRRITGKWIAALWTISIICTLAVGLSIGQRSMLMRARTDLGNIQAKLLFNKIEDEHHISDLMNSGCAQEASTFVDHLTDIDLRLLNAFLRNRNLDDARTYIEHRNPILLREAESYVQRFPNTWKESACS